MNDIAEITQVVLHERQGRDRGWWQQMRSAYLPDSEVHLSWFTGTGHEFVDRSEAMAGRGDRSVHRPGAPSVHVHGDRAFVELPAAIEVRIEVDGVAADLISYTRIVYRLMRRDGRWGIRTLDTIYERDTLTAAVPGEAVAVAETALHGFRAPYALLAWHLSRRGYTIGDDLLGDDRPEQVDAFYAEALAWLDAL